MLEFQQNYLNLVREEVDVLVDNYTALANSNIKFIDRLSSLLGSIAKTTSLDLSFCQQALCHTVLFSNFVECSNVAYSRIEDLIKERVTNKFMEKVGSFADLDLVDLFDSG